MDIRQILQALSNDDKALWNECRSNMRRAYITAHNMTIGPDKWETMDDAFIDLVDIRLALLFDRGGRLNATQEIIHKEDADKTVEHIESAGTKLMKSSTWDDVK